MHPIIKALKHHKTAAVLLTLEIALTLAIVANALLVIGDRLGSMTVTTGLPDAELVSAKVSGTDPGISATEWEARTRADLAALRGIPGVESVANVNSVPLSPTGYTQLCLYLKPGSTDHLCGVALYAGSPGYLATLGLHVVQGRSFTDGDHERFDLFAVDPGAPPPVIVSRAMADRLWPGENPLGKPVYFDKDGIRVSRVVGVSGHLLNPVLAGDPAKDDLNLLMPVRDVRDGRFVLRVRPGTADRVAATLPRVLAASDDRLVINKVQPFAETVHDYFRDDRALVWLLLGVIASLLALTGFGIFGLTGFWVQERVRVIGIRRALGATRTDIRTYFQMENLAIVTGGAALGAIMAWSLNLWLMLRYELPRLPLLPVAGGVLLVYAIGQLAVLQPSLRACRVSPLAAVRQA